MDTPASSYFYPPSPTPRKSPLGPLALLFAIRRNVLEIWTEADFREPIQVRKTIVDRRALINDPAAIHHVFVDNARNYEKNELQLRLLRPALGNGIITANGNAWRRQRQMLAPFFSPPRMSALAAAKDAAAAQSAARIADAVQAADGAGALELDIAGEMGRLTLEILEHTLFSAGLACAPSAFQKAITQYLDTFGRLDYFDLIGMPDWLPRWNRFKGRHTPRFAARVVDEMIDARRRIIDNGETAPSDLLTHLLNARDAQGQGLDTREVRDNIITFIGAGHETSANALTWTLYLLSQSIEWRKRVETEIDAHAHLGPEFTDLPITRAVIEETLRLYPPISMMSRIAREDDELSGVPIPAGTIVTVAPYVLHRHQTLWRDPQRFDPERFLGARREQIMRHAWMPFGAGGRTCIGMSFAMNEIIIVLRHLLRRFRFDLAPGHHVTPQVLVTMRPRYGMKMRVRMR